jgi:hypothetical protein
MPSHMSSIGFRVTNEEELLAVAQRAFAEGQRLPAPEVGAYVRWEAGGGAEVWIQLDAEGALVGLNPHFSGAARMHVGLTASMVPDDHALDGAFHAWADPQDEGPTSGIYPFVFDAPDHALHRGAPLPALRGLQLAAFAHQIRAFADEAAYLAAPQPEPRFAIESFVPTGLFDADGDPEAIPRAHALFTGRVRKAARLVNPATGVAFQWALVRTLGGEIDVVADPELVDGPLVAGSILQGTFWLSGRLLDDGSSLRA